MTRPADETVMAPLPDDDPCLVAWQEYTETESFANTRKHAANPRYVHLSLWAVFVKGWNAATAAKETP